MPILYVCLVNKKRNVITEGLGTKKVGTYKEQVLNYYDRFE